MGAGGGGGVMGTHLAESQVFHVGLLQAKCGWIFPCLENT